MSESLEINNDYQPSALKSFRNCYHPEHSVHLGSNN